MVMLHIGVCCYLWPCGHLLERADLLAVVCVLFVHFLKCVLVHIRIKGKVGALNWV